MNRRIWVVGTGILISTLVIVVRLFYWQIVRGSELAKKAQTQYTVSQNLSAPRGEIKTSDGFPLVTNREIFTIAVDPAKVPSVQEFISKLIPVLNPEDAGDLKKRLSEILKNTETRWSPIARGLNPETVQTIKTLGLPGLDFESGSTRVYPESSMAASLVGIVASDKDGNPQGYFGLEGFYDRELAGKGGMIREEKDAGGQPILMGKFEERQPQKGKDLILYLDRGAQFVVETALAYGITTYGASEGTIVVMNPRTGGIYAMASFPKFNPEVFYKEDPQLLHNPVVSRSFEPGSIFKPFIMAAAINEKAVTPETICDRCGGPWQIGEYSIHTWNDKYYPDSTTTEIIQHSDNVGMTFVADKLGHDKLKEYIKKFKFGQLSNIDLQDEDTPLLRSDKDWHEIDYATAAFGQGIATTPIQLVRAMAVIANGGFLVEPHVVQKIVSGSGERSIQPKIIDRILSDETTEAIKDMMVNAVDKGEAKWTALKGFKIAGKTGTAQVPVGGKYGPDVTNASFIGFAPADNPKFVMLVTLHNPTTSPWAAETAAPLWFSIARDLFVYWGISGS
jgi:cell division protein FtsI/penicillin-binding protein 2